jgi:hypothetical protein
VGKRFVTAIVDAALANLLSPVILSFWLGLLAGFTRSDLQIPDAIAKGLSVYLIFAIGLKGGVIVRESPELGRLLPTLALAAALSFALPLLAFGLLRLTTGLGHIDAAAVSAHYGSVSIVTFVAASQFLHSRGIAFESFMVAAVAVMETPAIVTGLLLAGSTAGGARRGSPFSGELLREVLLNGSVVLLLGAFAIGLLAGKQGAAEVSGFFEVPFKGALCLFLLDMGLVVARRFLAGGRLTPSLVLFGLYMPPVAGVIGVGAGHLLGLSVGGIAILATLCASASYIAVPAAIRLALPKADPAISLTLALGITFPFNITLGLPLYLAAAAWLGQP